MTSGGFRDRAHAGRVLGDLLAESEWKGQDAIVLALPRGGVPVAVEVAAILGAELDVLLVRKVGYPGQEELAMGAVADGGIVVRNRDVPATDEVFEQVTRREQAELERRAEAYRSGRPRARVDGRVAVLVDDGLATGSTMRAAVAAARAAGASAVVVAVPVGSRQAVELLGAEADDVVCPLVPPGFYAVGSWYDDFGQGPDEVVTAALAGREAV